jgi:hypothetical protein
MIELDLKLGKTIDRFQSSYRPEETRPQKASPCITRPGDKLPVGEKFLSSKQKILLVYVIIFHYWKLDEKHYYYFYLDLQDHIKENPNSFWLYVLLENKDYLLKWLEVQKTIGEGELFGQLLGKENLQRTVESILIVFEETFRKPRRIVRRKGYKDKGSLPRDSQAIIRREESVDRILSELQFQIEQERERKSQEIILLESFLAGERELSEEYLILFRIIKRKKENENDEVRVSS